MKKTKKQASEALADFLIKEGSDSHMAEKIISFLEKEKIMLPNPSYMTSEVAYDCSWEDESKEENNE